MDNLLWFGGWLIAVLALFVSALRLPELCLRRHSLPGRIAVALLSFGAVVAVAMLANAALTLHDTHFDLTRERVFTPDPDALEVVERLERPIRLTYFFREDDPQGKRAQHIVELMSRHSRYLQVTTVDPDRDPSFARTAGVKLYNAALLEADGRRIIVRSTDETEIAIGIQRVLRERVVEICFLDGHGEYPSDNYEFHTHVEEIGGGGAGHGHGAATAVVETVGHGVGRFRRSLEALGYEIREIMPATDGAIDSACRVVIDAGPRTPYTDIETTALQKYLGSGGAALLMYDLDFILAPAHAALLRRLGLELRDEVVIDPTHHYASDPEMVAVTAYEAHPVTNRMSFTFYPGARPLRFVKPAGGVTVTPLFFSSGKSYTQAFSSASHGHADDKPQADRGELYEGASPLAAASSGRFGLDAVDPARVIVVGDSDFASNSFFPYMSNNRMALAMVRWLAREQGSAPVAARIPVRRTVELTSHQQRTLFLILVVGLPLLVGCCGVWVWWRRR